MVLTILEAELRPDQEARLQSAFDAAAAAALLSDAT